MLLLWSPRKPLARPRTFEDYEKREALLPPTLSFPPAPTQHVLLLPVAPLRTAVQNVARPPLMFQELGSNKR